MATDRERGRLAITRRTGERLRVGDVWVIVTRVDRGRVALQIDAPRGVPIDREELLPMSEHYQEPDRDR